MTCDNPVQASPCRFAGCTRCVAQDNSNGNNTSSSSNNNNKSSNASCSNSNNNNNNNNNNKQQQQPLLSHASPLNPCQTKFLLVGLCVATLLYSARRRILPPSYSGRIRVPQQNLNGSSNALSKEEFLRGVARIQTCPVCFGTDLCDELTRYST